MGTPAFAIPSLEALIAAGHHMRMVVTSPDRERGRGLSVQPSAVKSFAVQAGLPLFQPGDLKASATIDVLRSIDADLIVVVAFRILPPDVFLLPRKGAINLHASLLPRYRGAAPINWAIINGEAETGVTTFFLKEKVDTGSIILQRSVKIRDDETAGTLHDRLAQLGAEVVVESVRRIEEGTVEAQVQDDAQASRAPKIFREDCHLDWSHSAVSLERRIRGLSPVPAAFTILRGKAIKLYRARTLSGTLAPGHVRREGDRLIAGTGDGMLEILELQQEGRRRMEAEEFLRGFEILETDRFEGPAPLS